jgi:hypothetical protein
MLGPNMCVKNWEMKEKQEQKIITFLFFFFDSNPCQLSLIISLLLLIDKKTGSNFCIELCFWVKSQKNEITRPTFFECFKIMSKIFITICLSYLSFKKLQRTKIIFEQRLMNYIFLPTFSVLLFNSIRTSY